RTSTDTGFAGASVPDSATLSQQALGAGATQDASPTDAATQQAAADEVVTMPATPLAHILLQLRAVVRAQRAASQVSRSIAAHRPSQTGKPTPQPVHTREQAKGAEKAYAKAEHLVHGGGAHAVDVSTAGE